MTRRQRVSDFSGGSVFMDESMGPAVPLTRAVT
jgi:hypothetical protein